MTRRTSARPVGLDLSHWQVDDSRQGELVRIRGEHGLYRLVHEVHNTRNGHTWITLYGGTPGAHGKWVDACFRSVEPHRVRPATKREAQRAS